MKTPDNIYQKALKAKERADAIIAQAKSHVPEMYHDFLVLLNETKLLTDEFVHIDDKTYKLGVWHKTNHGTIQTLKKPYLNVNGRLKWARDDHKESGLKLNFHAPVISEDKKYLTLRVESEMLGEVNVITEILYDHINSFNQDPITFAHTKAKGRALGDLGYGLIGDGVSSAEEVQQDSIEEPVAFTSTEEEDNEPKEVTVIATSEPVFCETHATFTGVVGNDDYTVLIPISKKKEIERIKRGFTVSGFAWMNGTGIRFSADNAIHVVNGVRRIELSLESSPVFADDGSCMFNALYENKKFLVKAPASLQEETKYLLKSQVIKVSGLFIKGIISLSSKNKIEVLTKKAG